MKKKLIFAIPLLILIPLSAFAEYATYDFVVGNGVTTIPQFIHAVLSIIVRIGIPVASLFLIWSGFMFITAGGNESKLSAAKKGFIWSCIGFGVLLGAWLLATAFQGVITSFAV